MPDLHCKVPLSYEDERAIAAVLIDYCTAIDRRDWALLRCCFAEAFEGDYGPDKRWRGADAITRYMSERHQELGATLHRLTNINAWRSPGGATARSYVDAVLMPRMPGGTMVEAIGWYDDELITDGGRWRIVRRRFTPVRVRESDAP